MNTNAENMQTLMMPALLPTYAPYPFALVGGSGDRVFAEDGASYWDFYGGHCVCATGHSHPKVAVAVADQAARLLFYSTAARLPIRDQAAESLVAFASDDLAEPLASVFFCNSGAEANENALKVAALFTGRSQFTTFQGGWHGRSTLALSVTDDPKIKTGLEAFFAKTQVLPFGDEAALAAADLSESAAVILEPIQSMAGIRTASPAFFKALRRACDQAGCLLIFDEVQTGMGRMGTPFASSFYGVTPDLTTSAKGLASGIPMGALLMTANVASRLKPGDLGSTFGGSPVACAALLATLEVIREEGLMDRASRASRRLREALVGTCVTKVEGEGLLLGLRVPGAAARLKAHLLAHRILVGGSGDADVLRLMPPLGISDEALDALITAIRGFQNA